MDALNACLSAAGGKPENGGKVQIFMTDIAERADFNPRRAAFFGDHRPASTLFENSALVDQRRKVEIECQAVIPDHGFWGHPGGVPVMG